MTDVWRHDELAADLGRWLQKERDRLVLLNLDAPVIRDPKDVFGDGWIYLTLGTRPDVYAVERFRHEGLVRAHAFEVKSSRADFMADMRSRKHRGYLTMAQQCSFACPAELIAKNECPKGFGLWWRYPDGWRLMRRAPNHGGTMESDDMLKLLALAHDQASRRPAYWRKSLAVPLAVDTSSMKSGVPS